MCIVFPSPHHITPLLSTTTKPTLLLYVIINNNKHNWQTGPPNYCVTKTKNHINIYIFKLLFWSLQ